jgi:hypothetical protein
MSHYNTYEDIEKSNITLNNINSSAETVIQTVAEYTPPVNTKGDIFTFSTTPQKLSIGTDNQILVADSSESTGLKWKDNDIIDVTNDNVISGRSAGLNQNISNSVAIGAEALADSSANTFSQCVAIGTRAGRGNEASNNIFVGYECGYNSTNCGEYNIIMGNQTGDLTTGATGNIMIGSLGVPWNHSTNYNVAIGHRAAYNTAHGSCIILNATGNNLDSVQSNSFYVAPIRSLTSSDKVLKYNETTKEITQDDNYTDPLTTKGDIFTFDTDKQRLAVGTNGQILSADSTETTGLKWIENTTYDDPLTTKGDIFTFDTDKQRLAVGTNGQSLVADSTETTGLKWANRVNPDASYFYIGNGSGSLGTPNTTGTVAIGKNALRTNANGTNIAIGEEANMTSGGYGSVCIGHQTARYGCGDRNLIFGYKSCYVPISGVGNNNCIIGPLCAYKGAGNYCIAVGTNIGPWASLHDNTITFNATADGIDTGGTNRFYVSPIRSATGDYALKYNTTSKEITYDYQNQGLATSDAVSFNGISNTSSSVQLSSYSSTWDVVSSRKIKKDIEYVDKIPNISELNVVSFLYKYEEDNNKKRLGLIAEDVLKTSFRDSVTHHDIMFEDEKLNIPTINQDRIFYSMLHTMQQLQKRIEKLEKELYD